MKLNSIAVPISCWFTFALVQSVATMLGTPAALGGAVAVGLLFPAALQFFHVELKAVWRLLMATGASFAGIVPALVGKPSTSLGVAFSPVLAFAAAGSVVFVLQGKHGHCALCNRRFVQSVCFRCPRCYLVVCDRDCWDFDNLRCRLCQQNRVLVLSTDPRWWNEQLGPRLAQGRCQLCLASSSESDLRACRKCGWAQCRTCWDTANGRCQHCHWLIPDLPPQLKAYLGSSFTSGVGSAKKVKLER